MSLTCQIAVRTLDNIIQVLLFTTSSQLQLVFAGHLDNTMPKSVVFTDNGGIYMFGLGNVSVLSSGFMHCAHELHRVQVSKDGKVVLEVGTLLPIDYVGGGFILTVIPLTNLTLQRLSGCVLEERCVFSQ